MARFARLQECPVRLKSAGLCAGASLDAYQVSAEKYNHLLKMLGEGGTLATLTVQPANSAR